MDVSDLLSMQVLRWVGLAGVIGIAWWGLKRLLAKPKADDHHVEVACACGWRGRVSRYKPRCPKCGAPVQAP